jgi:hypothetical protein
MAQVVQPCLASVRLQVQPPIQPKNTKPERYGEAHPIPQQTKRPWCKIDTSQRTLRAAKKV